MLLWATVTTSLSQAISTVFDHKDEQRGKNKENKGVFVFGSSFSGLRFRVFGLRS